MWQFGPPPAAAGCEMVPKLHELGRNSAQFGVFNRDQAVNTVRPFGGHDPERIVK